MLLQVLYLEFMSSHGAMAKVLDCDHKVNEFELQLHYYIHFQYNTQEKWFEPLQRKFHIRTQNSHSHFQTNQQTLEHSGKKGSKPHTQNSRPYIFKPINKH